MPHNFAIDFETETCVFVWFCYQVDLESYKKKLVRLGQENDKLSRQITELKHFRDIYEDSKKQLSACQEDRKKNVDTNRELCDEKDRKILSLQKDLQERDSWISIIKADPAKARGKIPEASKPVTKMLEEDADETVKSEQLSEAVQKEKVENQIYHGEGIQDDRGLASEEDSADSKVEADLEDSKVDADLEDTKAKTADLEESEQAATKVVGAEDEDDKDLENDSKMAAVDAVETNDKSAQEWACSTPQSLLCGKWASFRFAECWAPWPLWSDQAHWHLILPGSFLSLDWFSLVV